MRRYRVALSGDASKGNWAYLSDYDQDNEDQNIIYWGDTGVAGSVAMLVLDTSLDMLYFGTWSTRTQRVTRHYIWPHGGDPVYEWLLVAVKYYIGRVSQLNGLAPSKPAQIPLEYFRDEWIRRYDAHVDAFIMMQELWSRGILERP